MRTLILGLGLILTSQAMASVTNNGVNPGKQVLHTWLADHAEYPANAEANREEGVVYVSFNVTPEGLVEEVMVEQGVSEDLDRAAVELVQQMPVHDLLPVTTGDNAHYVVPIKFVIR